MAPTLTFRNLALWDRALRVIFGVTALALAGAGFLPDLGRLAFLLFAWVPLLTGIMGWCPVYSLFGFRTLRR